MSVTGIKSIPASEVSAAQVEGNLPDKPSQAGLYGSSAMSASQVKAAYDKLPKLIVEYYNALVSAISGSSDGSLASMIPTGISENHTLKDLFGDIKSGDFAGYLELGDTTLSEFYQLQLLYNTQVGTGEPDASTPGTVGSIYFSVNSTALTCYVCISASGGSYTWLKFAGGSGGEADAFSASGTYPELKAGKDSLGNVISETYQPKSGAADSIEFTVNTSTYVLTAALKAADGQTMSSANVDLPLESVVVGGSYDDASQKVVLTLQNGSSVEFSVADLVDGLVSASELNSAVAAKYTKPSGGIPESDLSASVQEKLNDDSGSSVIANVSAGESATELTTLQIENTVYKLPEYSEVTGNPSESSEQQLTSIKIKNGDGTGGSVTYRVSSVEANPAGTVSAAISKIKIDGTTYSLSGGDEDSLKLPEFPPSSEVLVGIDGNNEQTSIVIGEGLQISAGVLRPSSVLARISRADALPSTVDDNTADIYAIGTAEDTEFYFKNTSLPALTLSQDTIYFSGDVGASSYSDSETVSATGGTGTYSWALASGALSDISISPSGSSCTVSASVGSGDVAYGSTTLTCTSGEDSATCTINYDFYWCLTGDTLITMYGGAKKRIDEVKKGDRVLSFNPDSGLLEADVVLYSDSGEHKTHTHYDLYEFDDGTRIKVVHRHRLYNVETQSMEHLDTWKIGDRAYRQNGDTPKLTRATEHYEEGTINHYTIFTKNNNYFANGLLSGNYHTKPLALGGENNVK